MACCVISFTALTGLICWYRTWLSLLGWVWRRSCRTGSNRACIATSARKLTPWQSSSPMCSRFPRHARLIMASVVIMFIIRSKHFLQKVASVAIACSWTRSMLWPAFHRPNAMLASRCDWVFSCDLIFTPKFFRLPDTLLAHSFCIADGSPNNQHLWKNGFFVVGEKQSHCRSISIAPECAW